MKGKMGLWVVWLLICLYLGGCGGEADSTATPDAATPEANAGLANPASVFCEAQGGRVDIRETADGQQGVCVFDDSSECDEWAFFRGECSAPTSNTPPQSDAGQGNNDPAGGVQAQRVPDVQGMESVPLLEPTGSKDALDPAPAMGENSGVTPVAAPVEDWQGVIVSNPEGAQYDDYFQLLDQNGTRVGISGNDEISAQLAALRDTGKLIHVWGVIHYNVPDAYGAQIEVARLEVATSD